MAESPRDLRLEGVGEIKKNMKPAKSIACDKNKKNESCGVNACEPWFFKSSQAKHFSISLDF
jgi:hypothetical protein